MIRKIIAMTVATIGFCTGLYYALAKGVIGPAEAVAVHVANNSLSIWVILRQFSICIGHATIGGIIIWLSLVAAFKIYKDE